jgi:hypothetical protein
MARRLELVAALAATACGKPHEAVPASPAIPRATSAIAIDAEIDTRDWTARAWRADFTTPDGELARPSSELRMLHDDTHVVIALYAADEDIRSSDAFEVSIGTVALRFDAAGRATPKLDGVRTAIDRDGTLDDPGDDDEEWIVEAAIPYTAAGPLEIHASRCDVPKDGLQRCGSANGRFVLE